MDAVSSFWADKLGVQQQPAQAHEVPQQGPWWQRSIMPYQQPQQPVQQVPQQVPMQAPPGTPVDQQGVPLDPNHKYELGVLLRQSNYTTNKAQSAKVDTHCPECGGDNYLAPSGSKYMPQCYECGYNPRFTQQSSGMDSVPTVGPTHSARGQGKVPAGAPAIGTVIGTNKVVSL